MAHIFLLMNYNKNFMNKINKIDFQNYIVDQKDKLNTFFQLYYTLYFLDIHDIF